MVFQDLHGIVQAAQFHNIGFHQLMVHHAGQTPQNQAISAYHSMALLPSLPGYAPMQVGVKELLQQMM